MADATLRQLVEAVGEAADHALALWAGGQTTVRQWEKKPGDLVCEADIAVNGMLRDALGKIAPGAGWLSEETVDDARRLDCEDVWIVDPIDGTRDFLNGKPGWAVSVALVRAGKPILGVLAAPARNEIWYADANGGARRNGRALTASRRAQFPGARVPADRLLPIDHDLVQVDKPNSIALRMAMVGADEADLLATVRWGNEWDIAAATLIAQEAGAAVTDALGRPITFNRPDPVALGIVCCAPAIQPAALERIAAHAKAMADKGR